MPEGNRSGFQRSLARHRTFAFSSSADLFSS